MKTPAKLHSDAEEVLDYVGSLIISICENGIPTEELKELSNLVSAYTNLYNLLK